MSRVINALRDAEQARLKASEPAQPSRSTEPLHAPAAVPGPSWEVAIRQVAEALERCERQLVEQAELERRCGDEMQAINEQATQLQRQRQTLEQRAAAARQTRQELNGARASLERQLGALQECQRLSAACQQVESALRANAAEIAAAQEAQRRAVEQVARHQTREASLHQELARLQFELAKALASTGTIAQSTERGARIA